MSAPLGTNYRSREWSNDPFKSTYVENVYGQVTTRVTPHSFVGGQQTWSENHSLWKYQEEFRKGKALGSANPEIHRFLMNADAGGFFQSVKYEYDDDVPSVALSLTDGAGQFLRRWTFNGSLYPLYDSASFKQTTPWPTAKIPATLDLVGLGATAIARTIPTNPVAGAAQVLGELREGFPRIPGKDSFEALRDIRKPSRSARRRKVSNTAKKGSNEYLNWVFGVAPLVRDVRDLAKGVLESDRILTQLERDSGRLVRRSYHFDDQITNTVVADVTGQYLTPAIYVGFYPSGGGRRVTRRKTVTRTWFSGAYTYHFQRAPEGALEGFTNAKNYASHVLGLGIDPLLLWELTPWSWAADWITNFGDVMTNVSAFSRDDLVLRWGYLMQETVTTDTHTWTGNLLGVGRRTFTQTFTTTVKKRIKATPYGFSLDSSWNGFSPRQLGILSALGISRAAR